MYVYKFNVHYSSQSCVKVVLFKVVSSTPKVSHDRLSAAPPKLTNKQTNEQKKKIIHITTSSSQICTFSSLLHIIQYFLPTLFNVDRNGSRNPFIDGFWRDLRIITINSLCLFEITLQGSSRSFRHAVSCSVLYGVMICLRYDVIIQLFFSADPTISETGTG